MKKYIYPAMFQKFSDGEGFAVTFPDLPGAITEGDTLEQALYMAQDCLGGFLWAMEDDGDPFPEASRIGAFKTDGDRVFYSLISVDLAEYRRIHSEKPVRKTLYIPKHLNDKAEAKGINFSQVLREALVNKISA